MPLTTPLKRYENITALASPTHTRYGSGLKKIIINQSLTGEAMLINELTLHAPMSGPLVPLEKIPDPVFSQKLVGDGISIDPITAELVAPCAGTIMQVHRARHAVTLKTPEGIEILMHVGIDTVSLGGTGFTAHVSEGDNVIAGDLLLSFDADYVATKAASLLTQILITNGENVASMDYGKGIAQAGDTTILTLQLNTTDQTEAPAGTVVTSDTIIIANPQGLHARPSAMLANRAKDFAATITLSRIGGTSTGANIKSVVSIMGLELERGDTVILSASGDDANRAVNALSALIRSGLGEDCEPIDEAIHRPQDTVISDAPPTTVEALPEDGKLRGICASPGLAVGQIWRLERNELSVKEQGSNTLEETQALSSALKQAGSELTDLANATHNTEQKTIFTAHRELLSDPLVQAHAQKLISRDKSAAWAWRDAFQSQAEALSKLKNPLLAARAIDMRDVGQRVLGILLGHGSENIVFPSNVILVADDLTPSDTANLDPKSVLGFCTATGGASSHVAIIARSLNIPAIAGIDKRALILANGDEVLLRADDGILQLNPEQEEIDTLIAEREAEDILSEAALAAATEPAVLQSGEAIEVVTNIGNINDAQGAPAMGAEGVGLLRSEFLFMQRANAPTEDEQYEAYNHVIQAFAKDQKIIIRTLDVGGDKPLAYLPIPHEENPFLGLRGIRVSLAYKHLFRIQLRAILRASQSANVHIMFPMVTTLEDLRQAKAILEEERKALAVASIPVGIMVEVPSVALLAEQFAAEVDFFSIGTNDLTQYTLAVDRGHPELAKTADPLNPAVLAMIAHTAQGAKKHNIWVGVCGGIASDFLAAPLLLGLGVTELSCSLPVLPRIKAAVRDQTMAACQRLATKALTVGTTAEVRQLLVAHRQR